MLLIGEGKERAKLEIQIRIAGLEWHVSLAGFIPDAARVLPAFDIFVLPSIKEGLSYALMQAMASGLPVVASRVGGISDLVSEGREGLLVRAKDPKALAGTIQKLAADAAMRRRFGKAAQEKIATRFRFSAMIERTITLYDTAADR
jgi:glycosyltransferase involved in cell wall biosynthesis